jgi:hypothetical protein
MHVASEGKEVCGSESELATGFKVAWMSERRPG